MGKTLEFSFLDALKTTFLMKNLMPGWTQLGLNESNIFDFQKRAGEALTPSPLVARL